MRTILSPSSQTLVTCEDGGWAPTSQYRVDYYDEFYALVLPAVDPSFGSTSFSTLIWQIFQYTDTFINQDL